MSTKTSSQTAKPLSLLIAFKISPPFAVSRVNMHASTSGKVPPTPAVSVSSKTLIFSFGLNALRKL
jgi:hypothetical protein